MSFFIQSKLGNLVIDIKGGNSVPGTPLDAYTKKSAPGDVNQLWEFVPGPFNGYYFIQNPSTGLVIEILEGSPSRSLDASTIKALYPLIARQSWAFYPGPAPGYYYIASLVDGSAIGVQGGNTQPGTPLNAIIDIVVPPPFPDEWLWKIVGADGAGVTPPAPPTFVTEPSGGYAGTGNYVLANGSNCAALTNVQATIYVTEDLVWKSSAGAPGEANPQGFSIQLNAETNSNQALDWLQFVTHMGDDQGLWPWMNIWSPADINTTDPLWNQAVSSPVANMPQAARIPAGYMIIVTLQNDPQGRVTSATWNVRDGAGSSIGWVTYPLSTTQEGSVPPGGVPPDDLSQIASFQVTFGGVSDSSVATFSSGAGLLVYQADQDMTVRTSYPGCIGFIDGTGESSNVAYGPMSAVPGQVLAQTFNVKEFFPIPIRNHRARRTPAPRQPA